MRSKQLKGVAHNLAVMACSEARLGSDFEHLADLPDGEVTLDLIDGSAIHSTTGTVALSVVQSLASWLGNAGAQNVDSARVLLRIDTGKPPTHRNTLISFNFKGIAVLEARGRTYVGEASNHVLHNRPAQPSLTGDIPASAASPVRLGRA